LCTTPFSARESKIEGRVRLSCVSLEPHTAQWHPSVGTPIEVPDPSTVSSSRSACTLLEE